MNLLPVLLYLDAVHRLLDWAPNTACPDRFTHCKLNVTEAERDTVRASVPDDDTNSASNYTMPKHTSPDDIADALPGIMGRARGGRVGARLEVLALRAYLEAIERHIPQEVERKARLAAHFAGVRDGFLSAWGVSSRDTRDQL